MKENTFFNLVKNFYSVIDIFATEVRASGLRAPKIGEQDNNDAPLFLNLDGK